MHQSLIWVEFLKCNNDLVAHLIEQLKVLLYKSFIYRDRGARAVKSAIQISHREV